MPELPGGIPGPSNFANAAGNTIPYSPSFTYVIGATYTIASSIGEFALNANDSYNSGFYSEADNRLRQGKYHFVNASIAWTSSNGGLNARLYVNNILNKAVASQFASISGFGYIADYSNPPRIIGGSVGVTF